MLQVRSAARKRWHRWQDNHALRVRVARAMSIPTSPTRISFHSIKQTTAVWPLPACPPATAGSFHTDFQKAITPVANEWVSEQARDRLNVSMADWLGKASTVCVPLRLMRLKMNRTLRTRNTNWPFYPSVLSLCVLSQTVLSSIVPATTFVVAHLKSILNKPILNHMQ